MEILKTLTSVFGFYFCQSEQFYWKGRNRFEVKIESDPEVKENDWHIVCITF